MSDAPGQQALTGRTKFWTLFAVVLGSGIVFLDSTIVPVALPKIGKELSSNILGTLEAQSYVYYGYLLSLSALLILAGSLTDRFGRRRMFSFGLVGFGVTSILCGIAPNLDFLVIARVLQGATGAFLVPGSLAIITSSFKGEEQGHAFGIWAGASAATTILGPVLGGVLVATVSWRAAFLINAPLVLWALWATQKYVPESRDEEAAGRFHWTGAGIVALAVGGLTFGAIRGEATQWEEATAFVSLALGVIAVVAFPIVMRRAEYPLVPLELFRSRNFTVTNLSTLLIYGAIYVNFQFLALFAIGVLDYDEIGFGIAGVVTTVFLALFSAKFGKLADRYGPRIFMAVGPAIMGLGLLWFTRTPVESAAWDIDFRDLSTLIPPRDYFVDFFPALAVLGIGLMIMVAPLTTALMRSVPERHTGVASAFNNAVSRVGPQLAGAFLFIVISGTFYASVTDSLPGVDTSSPSFRDEVTPLNPLPDASRNVEAAADDASTDAFHLAMLISASLCFGGAAINALGIRSQRREEDQPQHQAVTPCPQAPPLETEVVAGEYSPPS
jgi:EmrB/QacA subfamily drug resistance transporter